MFFLDNNLSKNLAKGMKSFGEEVVHLQEIFPGDTKDEEWIKYVGEHGMILITRDNKIRWTPAEIKAIVENNVGSFFLGGKNLSRCKMIQQLVKLWPKIKILSTKTTPPYAFRLPPSGSKITRLVIR